MLNEQASINNQATNTPPKVDRRRLQRFAPAMLEICKYLICSADAWRIMLPEGKKQEVFNLLTNILGQQAIDPVVVNPYAISDIWYIEDVQSVRPDLTDDQAASVLAAVKANHDAEIGINWEVLEYVAQDLFGDMPEDFKGDDDD